MADTFYKCTGLTSITIPNSVTEIGYEAFYDCTDLTTLNYNAKNVTVSTSSPTLSFPNTLTTVNIGDSVQSIPSYFISNCASLTSITIPNSVTSIGNNAFLWCTGLASITIANSVTKIGGYAFWGCTGLREIYSNNATPPTVESKTFFSVDKAQCTLYVPKGCKDAYASADYWNEFTDIVEEAVDVRGDENGDGAVNISDVNAVINVMCGGNPNPKADVNLDGSVNISDVNAVIGIMCGN